MGPNDDHPALESVIRHCLQFLSIGRDLERLSEDIEFAASSDEAEIIYIFDANLFELFVAPQKQRGNELSFHSRNWDTPRGAYGRGHSDRSRAMERHCWENTLITFEFLFNGGLPGQRGGSFWMTYEHMSEWAFRSAKISKELLEKLGKASEENAIDLRIQIEDEVRRYHRAASTNDETGLDYEDRRLVDDVRNMLSGGSADTALIDSLLRSSIGVRLLAKDEIFEPAQQVNRILDGGFRKRIKLLDRLVRNKDRETISSIEKLARFWREQIESECETYERIQIKRASEIDDVADRDIRVRSLGAVITDAKSIALCEYLSASNTNANVRFVFLTADKILFNAYRRWYSSIAPESGEFGQPFLMRYVGQYVPLFTLADNTAASEENFFPAFKHTLEQVVEISALPLNLSYIENTKSRAPISRKRDLRALDIVELNVGPAEGKKPILEREDYRRLIDEIREAERDGGDVGAGLDSKSLSGVISTWRTMERAAVSFRSDLLDHRLPRMDAAQNDNDPRGRIADFIKSLRAQLLENSIACWIPLAEAIIETFFDDPPADPIRVPLVLHPELGGPPSDVRGWADGLKKNREEAGDAIENAELTFAVASAIALSASDWNNATQFTDMARQAYQVRLFDRDGRSDGAQGRTIYIDILYLRGLAYRFRIGAIGAPQSPDALNRINLALSEGQEALTQSLDILSASEFPAKDFLLLRAFSEAAALHIFHAWAVAPVTSGADRASASTLKDAAKLVRLRLSLSKRENASPLHADSLAVRAWESLQHAEKYLALFYALDSRLTDIADGWEKFIRRLRVQSAINFVSAAVLRDILSVSTGSPATMDRVRKTDQRLLKYEAHEDLVERRLDEQLNVDPATWIAEYAAYCRIREKTNRKSAQWNDKMSSDAALLLDRQCIEAIKTIYFSTD